MILFFIPTTDNFSKLIQKQKKRHLFEEKKYVLPKRALRHYGFQKNQVLIVDSVASFFSVFLRILSFRNKERAYIYLTGSEETSLLIIFLGFVSTSNRKIVNETGTDFDAYNIFTWMKYSRWRIRNAGSFSLRSKSIFLIPPSFLFVIIRSLGYFTRYKLKEYKKGK